MALYTQGKKPTKQFPSDIWKRKTVTAQHSVLRALQFIIYIESVPSFVHNHLVRHVHLQPYIRTMREDLTGVSSDEITRNTPNNGAYMVNAQELLHVMNARLCYKASKETRQVANLIITELHKLGEFELANHSVPNCIKLGYCPEYKPCGYTFEEDRKSYLDYINGDSNVKS